MIFSFIIFISVFLVVAVGAHWFLYYSLATFLNLTGSAKNFLLATFLLLPIIFISASAVAHYWNNVFSRGFYYVAGLWLGVATNLLVVALVCWVIFIINKIFGVFFDIKIFTQVLVSFAFLVSIFGVWNSYNPVIKNITVKIKNLPVQWQGKTAVQISDVHLGHVWREDFMGKVVSQINGLRPEAVFITGDLVDGMDGDLATQIDPLKDLKAPQGIYFVTGNHETYFGLDKVFAILKKLPVTILDDKMVDINGLQIVGLNFPERGFVRSLPEAMKNISGFKSELPSVLLYHSPDQVTEAKQLGFGLELSGHTHRGQLFPYNFITKIIYKGYDYGLFEENGFTQYTSSGLGTWGPTMRTNSRPEIVVIKFEKI